MLFCMLEIDPFKFWQIGYSIFLDNKILLRINLVVNKHVVFYNLSFQDITQYTRVEGGCSKILIVQTISDNVVLETEGMFKEGLHYTIVI